MSRRANERGFALMWALFLLILVGALTGAMLQRDLTIRQDQTVDQARLRALHAAEGGLAKARHALARDPSFRAASLEIGGTHVAVSASPAAAGGWHVISRARDGGVCLDATLRPTQGLPRVETWRER